MYIVPYELRNLIFPSFEHCVRIALLSLQAVVRRRAASPLPVAQVAAPRHLNDKELQRLVEVEEATLRELRIFLRQICAKLARNRQ